MGTARQDHQQRHERRSDVSLAVAAEPFLSAVFGSDLTDASGALALIVFAASFAVGLIY